jgi:TetR/AcrR family transcriptional regulator, mexJK operon transcriptional repressor
LEPGDETRSARKRRAILEAARAVFLDTGYQGSSVDQIAAQAAVSKQTVYKHFADKEQLFTRIILDTTDQIDGLVDAVTRTLAHTDDVAADLSELANQFVATLMQPHVLRLRRLVIANADRFPETTRQWYEHGFDRVLATLSTRFEALAERGLLRLEDPLLAAHHFVALLLWIPLNQVMFCGDAARSSDADLARYADAAVRTFLAAYGQP